MANDYAWSFYTSDTVAPTGSIVIKGNDQSTTESTILLTFSASDNSGNVALMQIRNDQNWNTTDWEPFALEKEWDLLTSGDVVKTVYVKFRDATGNESTTYQDSITLNTDTLAPSITIDGGLSFLTNTNNPPFILSGTTDEDATISAEITSGSQGTVISCNSTIGMIWSCELSSLVDGEYTIEITATDLAGNPSNTSAVVSFDSTAPSNGSISIDSDTEWSNSLNVSLTLNADDPLISDVSSGVSNMRLKNEGGAWRAWEPYSGLRNNWLLTPGVMDQVVYVQFKDGAGNESVEFFDTIKLDTSAPQLDISYLPLTNNNTIGISAFTEEDASVSVGQYSCTWIAATEWDCSVTLLAGNNTFTITSTDAAGNSSTEDASILYDVAGPIAISIIINDGATATNSPFVTLSLAANDNSGAVAFMRFSNDISNWSTSVWEPYTNIASWELSGDQGPNTVYAQFKDSFDNLSNTISDTVELDSVAPNVSIDTISPGASLGNKTNISSQTISGTRSADAEVQLSISPSEGTWAGPPAYNGTSWSAQITLAEGLNSITASAVDQAQNNSIDSVTSTITLDTIAEVSINPVMSPTNQNTQPLSGTITEDAQTFSLKINSVEFASCSYEGNAWNCVTSGPTSSLSDNFMNALWDFMVATALAQSEGCIINGPTWNCQGINLIEGIDNNIVATVQDSLGNVNNASTSIYVDTTEPTGSISINNGAEKTNSISVILFLNSADASQMRFSNDNLDWAGSTWVPFSSQKSWQIPSGDSPPDKMVYAQFMDSVGNVSSSTISDGILLDTIAPTISINSDLITSPTNINFQTLYGTIEPGATVSITAPGNLSAGVTYSGDNDENWQATVNLIDGWNNILITAYDGINTSGSISAGIYLDKKADVAITQYAPITNNSTLTISGTKETNSSLVVKVNNQEVCSLDLTADTTWECELSNLQEGPNNEVVATATDVFSNIGNDTISIELDIIKPTATLLINNGDTITGGSLSVSLSLNSISEPIKSTAYLSNDEVQWQARTISDSITWYLSPSSTNGTKAVYARITDLAGNESNIFSDTIDLDITGPQLTITQPTPRTNIEDQTISVLCSSEPCNMVQFSMNNGNITNCSDINISTPGTEWECSSALNKEGTNSILVIGKDNLNNTTHNTISIIRDTSTYVGFTPTSISSPTRYSEIQISGYREYNYGNITSLTVKNSTGTIEFIDKVLLTGSAGWSGNIILAEGDNLITVTAQDDFSNQATAETTILLDTLPPSITVPTVSTPTRVATQLISGEIEQGAELFIISSQTVISNIITNHDTNPATWTADLTLAEGNNEITLYARDSAGNITTEVISDILLNSIAKITVSPVISPTNQPEQNISGTKDSNIVLDVCLNSSTPPSCSTQTSCPAPVCTIPGGQTTWSCSLTLFSGINDVYLYATENVVSTPPGTNCNDSISTQIEFDPIPPSVTVTNSNDFPDPPEKTRENSTYIEGIKSIDSSLTITGVKSSSINENSNETDWVANVVLNEGLNTIEIVATDLAGNTATASVQRILDSKVDFTVSFPPSSVKDETQSLSGTRESGSTVNIFLNNEEITTCDILPIAGETGSVSWECFELNLLEGDNILEVRVTDDVGNKGSASKTINLDKTAPTVSLNPFPPSLTADSQIIIKGLKSEDAEVNITGAVVLWTNYPTESEWLSQISLSEGVNTITITAVDEAGNTSLLPHLQRDITRDSTNTLTLDPYTNPSSNPSPIISGGCDNGSAISVSATPSCDQTCSNSQWTCTVNLIEGDNQIIISSNDGVTVKNITADISIDTVAPDQVDLMARDTLIGDSIDLDWSTWASNNEVSQGVVKYKLFASTSDFSDIDTDSVISWSSEFSAEADDYRAIVNNERWYFAAVAIDAAGNYNKVVNTVSANPTAQGIEGRITSLDDQGNTIPLLNAFIRIGNDLEITPNLEDGYYLKTGLVIGDYLVTVSGDGYISESRTVQVSSGSISIADFSLSPDIPNTPPGIPENILTISGDGEITISWDPVSDADLLGYNLYRSVDGTNFDIVNIEPFSNPSYDDTGLINLTTYYYVIKSVDSEGLQSDGSEVVSLTPQALIPDPPSGLQVMANQDDTITLTWDPSPTEGVTGYNIYSDNGTGTIDYTSPTFLTLTSWTSNALTPGTTYYYGVRAIKGASEEDNIEVVGSATIPIAPIPCTAIITNPKAGKRIAGNRLNIRAELQQCNTNQVEILFQYKKASSSGWTNVPSAVIPHPNPDKKPPYKVHWNVDKMTEGNYELRAVARTFDNGGALLSEDTEPPTVSVLIDHHHPDLEEKSDQKSDHRCKQKIHKTIANNIEFTSVNHKNSVEVTVPPNALETNTSVIAEIPKLIEMDDKVNGVTHINRFLRLTLDSGQQQFSTGNEVEISIPYPDEDDDGFVDGAGYSENTLSIRWYNKNTRTWDSTGITEIVVDTINKKVRAKTSHFTDFILVSTVDDTDGDGLSNDDEINLYYTDPIDPDTDNDGLYDGEEINTFNTNPLVSDTDDDGLLDGAEVDIYGTNPLTPDSDSDGVNDGSDAFPNDPTRWEAPPPTKVPVHNGLWLIPSMLTGLYLLRRQKGLSA